MLDKPTLPKTKKISIFDLITTIAFFLVISFIFIVIWEKHNQSVVYNAALQKHKQIEKQQEAELSNQKKEVINYIHSIDAKYDIDNSGTIPVTISVSRKRDEKAQYIGSEMTHHYTLNGKEVRNKSNLRINLFHEIDIQTEIIENDPASDDIGREKTSKAYTFLEINNGILLQQTVYIKEYYGADAGHVDIYHVEDSIKPAKTLKLSSSQIDNFPQYPILPNEPKKADYKLSIIETINMFPTVKLGIGIRLLKNLTNNVNQMAKSLHEQGSIYETEIDDIRQRVDEIWSVFRKILARLDHADN